MAAPLYSLAGRRRTEGGATDVRRSVTRCESEPSRRNKISCRFQLTKWKFDICFKLNQIFIDSLGVFMQITWHCEGWMVGCSVADSGGYTCSTHSTDSLLSFSPITSSSSRPYRNVSRIWAKICQTELIWWKYFNEILTVGWVSLNWTTRLLVASWSDEAFERQLKKTDNCSQRHLLARRFCGRLRPNAWSDRIRVKRYSIEHVESHGTVVTWFHLASKRTSYWRLTDLFVGKFLTVHGDDSVQRCDVVFGDDQIPVDDVQSQLSVGRRLLVNSETNEKSLRGSRDQGSIEDDGRENNSISQPSFVWWWWNLHRWLDYMSSIFGTNFKSVCPLV